MGSKSVDGVHFRCYSLEHPPPHVHAFYAGHEVIIELLADGTVRVAGRKDAISPKASSSDVRYMLDLAHIHAAELMELWRSIHG